MRKLLLLISSTILFSSVSMAADVVCGCEDDNCKDIEINFVPANPGVYLSVKYNDGKKNVEGYATVVSNEDRSVVSYTLGRFMIVKEDNAYTIPLSNHICK